ncbi:MAG: NAD-dependent epimerase/dehydratase family protein, partial [bacterium]
MRVLVPGGSGFIGSYLADELLADHEVHAAGLREDVSSVESFYGRPVPYIHCDYSIESLEEIIERVKPDAVVNLAAKRPATKDKDISSYYRNLYISANMFEACFNKGVLNLVNISTRLVYSQFNSIPWRESEPPAPQNYYGLSKQWSEDAAAFYNRKG